MKRFSLGWGLLLGFNIWATWLSYIDPVSWIDYVVWVTGPIAIITTGILTFYKPTPKHMRDE